MKSHQVPHKTGIGYLFDASKKLIGKQSLKHGLFFKRNIPEPWNNYGVKVAKPTKV